MFALTLLIILLRTFLFIQAVDEGSKKDEGAVYYSIFLPSFYDSNGDGIGDLNGAALRLTYLKDLGVNHIILSAVYQTYRLNETAIYNIDSINPALGNLKALQDFITAAHDLKMKVLLTIDPNCVSIHSHWFQEGAAHHQPYYTYFNWSDNPVRTQAPGWFAIKNSDYVEKYHSSEGSETAELWMDNDAVKYDLITGFQALLKNSKADGYNFINTKKAFTNMQSSDPESWWTLVNNYLHRTCPGSVIISDSYMNPPGKGYNFFDAIIDSSFSKILIALFVCS